MAIISPVDNRPVYLSSLGTPLVFGRLYAFAKGTDNAKEIYTDEALTTPASHPVLLGDDGRSTTQLFCGAGQYTIVMRRFVGVDPMTAPDGDWDFDNSFDLEGNVVVVAPDPESVTTVGTIAELRLIDPADFVTVDVLGYYTDSDSFTRRYRWDGTSALSDNYGAVIGSSVTGTGRWILQQEGSSIDCRAFGLIPGLTSTYNSQFTAMEAWANAASVKAIYFPAGTYRFGGAYSFNVRPKLILERDVKFYNTVVLTAVLFNLLADYEIRLTSGIKHSSSVGSVRLTFNSSANNDEVRALWFGHVNGTDDHSTIAADIAASVAVNHTVVLENVLNVATLTAAFPIRLKTVGLGLLNVTHDPSGNNYRVELYDVDMGEVYALKLTYPNVLSIDYLKRSRLRASWFDNANALTDWSSFLESTGIHHTAAYPTLILDDNIKFASAMSDNAWTIVSEGGEMDIHAAGVEFYRIQAGDVPLFSALSTHAPAIRCAVRGTWWDFAGCTTNQTIEYAITAASAGGGIVADFAGCGAMTGYSVELVIDNEIEIRNLSMTGTGDFRPQASARFIDCTLARTGGATGAEAVITLTGGGTGSGTTIVRNCEIRGSSTIPAITHNPAKLIVEHSVLSSAGGYVISIDALEDTEVDVTDCEIEGAVSVAAISSRFHRNNFTLQNSLDIVLAGKTDFSHNRTNIDLQIDSVDALISGVTICHNEFTPYSVTSPATINIRANEAGTFVHGLNITGNIFSGSLTSRTVMITSELVGAGTWDTTAANHTLVVADNTTSSAGVVGGETNVIVPATRGSSYVYITQKTSGPRQRIYFNGTRHETYPDVYKNRFFYLEGTEMEGYLSASLNDTSTVTTSQINNYVASTSDADGDYVVYTANSTIGDNNNEPGFAFFDFYTSGGLL